MCISPPAPLLPARVVWPRFCGLRLRLTFLGAGPRAVARIADVEGDEGTKTTTGKRASRSLQLALAYAHPSTTEYVPLILQEGRKWSPSAFKGSDLL
jgi:hypothetical protein